MFSTIGAAIVALLTQLLPIAGTANATVASILNVLIELLPPAIATAQELVAPIQNIIQALSANPATTAAELATLQTLDEQCDAAFEAAATQAGVPAAPSATS